MLDNVITEDIEPYELTKLRLLNAEHSCLAHLSAPDGLTAADAAMAKAIAHARTSDDASASFLDFGAIFSPELAGSQRFRDTFTTALLALRTDGVQSAILHSVDRAEASDGRQR